MAYVSVFFIVQLLFGFLIFGFFDPRKRFNLPERIAASVLVGFLFSGFIILILGLILSSLDRAIISFLIIFSLVLVLRNRELISLLNELTIFIKEKKWISLKRPWAVCLLLIILIYSFFLSTVLFRGADGFLRAVLIGWGDTAFHIETIKRFSTADPFDLNHPLMAGVKLTYPFMINFISGVFHKIGAGLILAYRLPLYIFGIISFVLIFFFASKVLKSKNFAILALVFILLGSGSGFLVFFDDLNNVYKEDGLGGFYRFFSDPLHEYTHLDNRTGGKPEERDGQNNIIWIVPIVSFLSHQRSFTLGLAIFSLLLLGIYYYGRERYFWRFGLLAGLLPLSHSHSFLALFFLLAVLFWFFLSNWRSWLGLAISTSILAIPQLYYLKSSSKFLSDNIFRPWFGWMTCEHDVSWFFCSLADGTDSNPFLFWAKNFGVVFLVWLAVIVIILVSFFNPLLKKKLKENFNLAFISSSFLLFLLPNLFLFQPWSFDNNKILFYWWILAIIFCLTPVLKFLWKIKIYGQTLVILLVFLAILAGAVDFASKLVWTKKFSYGYADASKDNIEMAQWIEKNTSKNSLFLTSSGVDPVPLFLSGRPVYLGFEGWLWTQGLDYWRNKTAAGEILAGNLEKACQEKIDFILLDNELKKDYPEISEETILEKTETAFPQNTSYGERKLLKVVCPVRN